MARRRVRGFAWLVYPDAQPPDDRPEPGRPFATDARAGAERPPGVVDFWPMSAALGLENDRTGETLLVITQSPDPPPTNPTYKAAPAELQEGFEVAGGLARLVRVVGTHPTGVGTVPECEFEADEDLPLVEASGETGPGPDVRFGTTGAGARSPGRSSAGSTTGVSIGMGAGEAGNQGVPRGGNPADIAGAKSGHDLGPGITGARNAIEAGRAQADDPARSIASPDEIAAEAGESSDPAARP